MSRSHRMLRPAAPSAALALLAAAVALALPAGAFGFEDVTGLEGLHFQRAGNDLDLTDSFLERMGGGACWLDVDGDSLLDLFLPNGWFNQTWLAQERQPKAHLYRNLGAGQGFVEVAAAAGIAVQGWHQACSAADYDGDGDDDLALVGYGIQSLYRNAGDGTFANVTPEAGLSADGKCGAAPCWGSGSAWGDYDRDGDLDLYVINFVDYNLTDGGVHPGPGDRPGQANQLYRNDGDGTFTDVSAAANATNAPGNVHAKDWGVTWFDYDRDGWLDLYIAGDGVPNALLRNLGDGTFEDVAEAAGVADARSSMGLVANDCDDDGDEDLFFTHYGNPIESDWTYDGFYVNEANGTFSDHSGEGDLNVTYPYVKWGVGWEDLDNDGDLDLHVATGHTDGDAVDFSQPPLLWVGHGDCTWTDWRANGGPAMKLLRNSRGTSYADYDLDGDVDVAQVNIMNQTTLLLANTGEPGNHWLTLELRDPGMNTRGIGAEVNVTTPDGRTQHRRMNPYQSIHGNNAMQVHVGLGAHASANVTVRWPDTWDTVTYHGLAADQLLRLHRDGRVQNDTFPPRSSLVVTGAEPGEEGWWRGSEAQVHAVAADAGLRFVSGVAQVALRLDGGAEVGAGVALPLAEGAHVAEVWSEDVQGNREVAREVFVGLDAGAPVSEASLEGTLAEGWYQGPVRVTLACADAVSGPSRLEWRIDAEPWVVYAGPFDLTRPGSHVFGWRCVDKAGNVEATQSRDVAVDLGHPETVPRLTGVEGLAGWWRSSVEVALDAYAAPRGLAGTSFALDGGPWSSYGGPFLVEGDGVHEVRFRSVDDAGNEEPEKLLVVRVDATPPDLALADQGPHVRTPEGLIVGPRHVLALTAADAASGVASVLSSRDGGPLRGQVGGLVFSGEGAHTLRAVALDAAGNAGEATWTVVLDTTPPSLEVVVPAASRLHVGPLEVPVTLPANPTPFRAILVGAVPMEAGVADDVAGIRRVVFTVDSKPAAVVTQAPYVWWWDLPPSVNPMPFVGYTVEDRVGNQRYVSFQVVATGAPDPLVDLLVGPVLGWLGLAGPVGAPAAHAAAPPPLTELGPSLERWAVPALTGTGSASPAPWARARGPAGT